MGGVSQASERRRERVLTFIQDYIRANEYPPTRREIAKGCDISSTSVVDYQLMLLDRAGAIIVSDGVARGIRLCEPSGVA